MTGISWLQKGIIRIADLLPLHLAWELHKKFSEQNQFMELLKPIPKRKPYYYVKLQDAKEWITVKGAS